MELLIPPIAPVDFSGIMTFAWIAIFLVVGMFLRFIFPLFSKYLIPSCIIGGVVGFFVQNTGLLETAGLGMDPKTTQLIVFHLFCLTWIYVGLRKPEKSSNDSTASSTKTIFFYWGVLFMSVYAAMALTMTATTLLSGVGLNPGPETDGSIIAYGFIGGPGQALTVANIIEAATNFKGLPDFALAGGAMGFAVAIVVGIFLLNIIARKKKIDIIACPSEEEQCGFYNECTPTEEAGKQTTVSSSIDVLAWHIAIGLVTYFLTYVLCVVVYLVLPPSLKIYVWTTFYTICAVVGIGVRVALEKRGKGHILCNGLNTRISNTLVDFLVCGTFVSIEVGNIIQYFAPFIGSVTLATISFICIYWIYCSKLKEEGPEVFAYLFGMSTGTISTAFVLLRLVDPQNKSHVPIRLAMANVLNLTSVIILPILVYMQPLHNSSPWVPIGISLGLMIIGMIIARVFRQPMTKTAWEPYPDKN